MNDQDQRKMAAARFSKRLWNAVSEAEKQKDVERYIKLTRLFLDVQRRLKETIKDPNFRIDWVELMKEIES